MRPKDRSSFNQLVYEICRSIPPGHVMTYGGIAACIEHPANMDPLAYDRIKARWVGYALKDCPEDVPWHRVINARGQISARPGHDFQRTLLDDEGITFGKSGRINLKRYNWKPLNNR
ncbi:MAG: MGMT family protein [Anaerolineales bacterium]